MDQPRKWFIFGCAFEALVGLIGLALAALTGQSLASQMHWSARDACVGAAATIPMLAVLGIVAKTRWSWAKEIVEFLELHVRPIFGRWSFVQLALISALAGVGEELLFRGVIQSELARWAGPAVALALTSGLFGFVHAVTKSYAVLAASIGVYLGGVWLWSGNLLVPMTAHALYDFVALIYFLRIRTPSVEDR